MLQVLGTAGFSGALLLSSLSSCDTAKDVPTRPVPSAPHNPFSLAATNLPYTPVMFGTGLPARLKRQEAIQTINHAFAAEGLAVNYDTLIEANGVRLYANAYNAEHHIGYVWIDYTNMGPGTSRKIAGYKPVKPESLKEYKKMLKERLVKSWQDYQDDPEQFLEQRLRTMLRDSFVVARRFRTDFADPKQVSRVVFEQRWLDL